MKIKIEDMEFELDDYRTGKINKKVRNLSCINSSGYNFNRRNNENLENEKTKTVNNINKNNNNSNNAKCIYNNMEKSIYVNSKNNNYLISKLKKENENLRLIISEYENNLAKLKMKEKKIKQKKVENTNRLARKIINNRQPSINKSSNNILSNMSNINNFNNTYTTNFYHVKARNKFSTNASNSSKINESNINSNHSNINQSNINSKILPVHSYIINNSKIVKSRTKKSLSVFHSTSKTKSKKEKNEKNKTNFKKINNINNNIAIIGEDNDNNIIEIKIKEKNNNNNSRIHTVNNSNNIANNININSKGQSSKNVFSWKKKVVSQKRNVEISMQYNTNNTCTTERRKTETNNSQSNSNIISPATNNTNRNNGGIFIPKKEFNLTWSRFPRKEVETSFDNYTNKRNFPNVIMSSKDFKKNEKLSTKFISKAASKNRNRNSVERFDNSHTKEKIDSTPQKITINRKIISNKMKTSKNYIENNNASMKNITNMNQKIKKSGFYDNKASDQNVMNISASNKMLSFQLSNLHKNEIYCHKKRNSLLGIGLKNISNDNTNDSILKKNSYMNSKYNVTINNINNCNYYNLIQGTNKPGIKIKKKISKNN